MLQFTRVKADAQDGLLEKFRGNVDYGGEEMVVAQANALQKWVQAHCTGVAWVELLKHVEYRAIGSAGFSPEDVDWELSVLFNDPADAARFTEAHSVVDEFSTE